MAKPARSMKLTPGQINVLTNQLNGVEAHISKAAEVWQELLPAQREALLANNPILAHFVALAHRFEGGRP